MDDLGNVIRELKLKMWSLKSNNREQMASVQKEHEFLQEYRAEREANVGLLEETYAYFE
jgi:hypothetical protein